jgi:hypothetical protein
MFYCHLLCTLCIFSRLALNFVYLVVPVETVRAAPRGFALLTALPFMLHLATFSLLVSAWAAITYFRRPSDSSQTDPILRVRPLFVAVNLVASGSILALMVALDLKHTSKRALCLAAAVVVVLVLVTLAVVLLLTGSLLAWHLALESARRSRKISRISISFALVFLAQAGVLIRLVLPYEADILLNWFMAFTLLDAVGIGCLLYFFMDTLDRVEASFGQSIWTPDGMLNVAKSTRKVNVSLANSSANSSSSSGPSPYPKLSDSVPLGKQVMADTPRRVSYESSLGSNTPVRQSGIESSHNLPSEYAMGGWHQEPMRTRRSLARSSTEEQLLSSSCDTQLDKMSISKTSEQRGLSVLGPPMRRNKLELVVTPATEKPSPRGKRCHSNFQVVAERHNNYERQHGEEGGTDSDIPRHRPSSNVSFDYLGPCVDEGIASPRSRSLSFSDRPSHPRSPQIGSPQSNSHSGGILGMLLASTTNTPPTPIRKFSTSLPSSLPSPVRRIRPRELHKKVVHPSPLEQASQLVNQDSSTCSYISPIAL